MCRPQPAQVTLLHTSQRTGEHMFVPFSQNISRLTGLRSFSLDTAGTVKESRGARAEMRDR